MQHPYGRQEGKMAKKPLFPGQLDDERVIIYERRCWYTIFKWIGGRSLLFLLISLVIAWIVTSLSAPLSSSRRVFYWLIILAPALTWLVWKVLDWENDRYIVTDKRVIHIEKTYLTREERDEAPLAMIQDVSIEMKGLMTLLLYFGDVTIQTAGTLGTIRFKGIRKPRKAQAQILALVSQVRAAMPVEEEPQAIQAVREIVGWPRPEPKPLPPAAERLRWESEKPRRAQMSEVIKMMIFPRPVFGENQLVWRKHWWVLLKGMLSPLLALVILLILWSAASLRFGVSLWFDLPLGISLAVTLVWFTWRAIDWRNDLYIITDDRAIDIEKVPFVREERREAGLDKIQDVRYLQEGFIALRLDFGNVRLETAGGIEAFTFDAVPHPREVQIEIFDRIDQFHRRAEREGRKRRQAEILDLLARYHQGVQGDGETES
jgi:uncharacterized membrane protein YdbT with pleckstrin-like domain